MDWIRRRQIGARPFLRHEKFNIFNPRHSNSVRVGVGERGKRHEFNNGDIHGTETGIYYFSFTGLARLFSSSSYVDFSSRLYLNGNLIGSSYVLERNTPVDQYNSLTLQSTLNLKKGDQLWVQIYYIGSSYLYDSIYHLTHFTGFMLEEEIDASL
jgi:hypothetical protein